MKKVFLLFVSSLLLLSGCQNPPSSFEDTKANAITVESNIYDFNFMNLYEQIKNYTEAIDNNDISLSGIDANEAINFIFTPNGDIKYMEIGCSVLKDEANGSFFFSKFKISNELTQKAIDQPIEFVPQIAFYGQNEIPSHSGNSFSKLEDSIRYLDSLNLQNIIQNYHIGNPTAYFLKSGSLGAVSSNYINDIKNYNLPGLY